MYLDIALLVVILGGIGVFVFMQHAPATETQEGVDVPATGCCGSVSKVEGETSPETAGGCCGTSKSDASQSVDNSQQVLPLDAPETNETASPTPQSENADTGGDVVVATNRPLHRVSLAGT